MCVLRGGDAVGRYGGQLDSSGPGGFTPSEEHRMLDACEDGDNQPPPDAHQLLLHQESANNRGDVVE